MKNERCLRRWSTLIINVVETKFEMTALSNKRERRIDLQIQKLFKYQNFSTKIHRSFHHRFYAFI